MRSLHSLVALASVSLPIAAQDLVWSSLVPSTADSWIVDVAPLANGATLGLQRTVLTSAVTEWLLLDPSGAVAQSSPLPSSTLWFDAFRVASDGAGGAYLLVSDSSGGLGGASLGSYDAVVLRFDSSGQLQWTRRFGGNGIDVGRDVLPDGANGFYLAGDTNSSDFGTPSGHPRDAFVARVDGTGAVLWVRRNGEPSLYGRMDALASDGSGGILAGGSMEDQSNSPIVPEGFAFGFDAAGTPQFVHSIHPFGGLVLAIERTSSGYIELAISPFGGYFCTARNTSGAPLWSIELDPVGGLNTLANSLVRRADGTYLIGGSTQNGPQSQHVRAFMEGGTVLWDRSYPGPAGERTSLSRLALDGLGGAYVAGSTNLSSVGTILKGRVDRIALDPLGTQECAGQANSSGTGARTRSVGSLFRGENALTLFTDRLPPASLGYYLSSRTAAFVPGAGGGQGDLCLGGTVGRWNRPGEVGSSGAAGRFHLRLDLGSVPGPTGSISAVAGETWRFQAWYRDGNPSPTSNFSSAVAVTLF